MTEYWSRQRRTCKTLALKKCQRCGYEYKRLRPHVGGDECISNQRKTELHKRGFVQVDNQTYSRLCNYAKLQPELVRVIVRNTWAGAAFYHQSYVWLLQSLVNDSSEYISYSTQERMQEVFASIRDISDETERYRTAAVMARLNWANAHT